MKVLIDVNVALDVILERQPWLDDSKGVWDACHETRIVGHLIATAVTNIFYISRRIIGTEKARAGVHLCLATFEITPVGRQELEQADAMAGIDLEDKVSLAFAWPRAWTPSSPAIRRASSNRLCRCCLPPNCWRCFRRAIAEKRIRIKDRWPVLVAPRREPARPRPASPPGRWRAGRGRAGRAGRPAGSELPIGAAASGAAAGFCFVTFDRAPRVNSLGRPPWTRPIATPAASPAGPAHRAVGADRQ